MLGPLLSLLYINDMRSSYEELTFYLFVDDTNIFYADKNLNALEQTANSELHKLLDWLASNKLTLNIKTNPDL